MKGRFKKTAVLAADVLLCNFAAGCTTDRGTAQSGRSDTGAAGSRSDPGAAAGQTDTGAPAGNQSGSKAGTQPSSGSGNGSLSGLEHDILSYDGIVSQCPGCEDALKHRLAVEYASACIKREIDKERRTIYEKKLKEYEAKVYQDMQHKCTADVVYVTNYPLSIDGHDGTYTGYWKGGGPSGQGEFNGAEYSYNTEYCYSGDWRYGQPEGYGSLYRTRSDGTWSLYTGQMQAGVQNGKGYLTYSTAKFYCYLDESTYSDGSLSGDAAYYKVDFNGDLREYGTFAPYYPDGMQAIESHTVPTVGEWAQTLLIAAAGVAAFSALNSLFSSGDSSSSYGTPVSEQIARANAVNAQTEAERKAAVDAAKS